MRQHLDPHELREAVNRACERSTALFSDLAANAADEVGVTRTSYGKGEQYAHRLLERTARALSLEAKVDAAGNLYMTLPGRDRTLPRWVVGSHMDSVPRGGNFDAAAGVIAGFAAIESLQQLDFTCQRDIMVMAIRAEEAAWCICKHGGHLGSRMALGLAKPDELDTAVRWDTGRTLGEHMRECGCDIEALRSDPPFLKPERIEGYVELHIEQGPVLEQEALPVGGRHEYSGQFPAARCALSGQLQPWRRNAAGTSQRRGRRHRRAGHQSRRGMGKIALRKARSDVRFRQAVHRPKVHSMSKVPGEVRFSLDLRSGDPEVLASMRKFVQRTAETIGAKRKVNFELGDFSIMEPTVPDPALREALLDGCDKVSIPYMERPSGGGHDAQESAKVGVPAAMIFIRNAHGSHVAEESMEMADFAEGTRLMTWMLALR
jgi:N-carbamoyl-L-amino-acid hydrolase